MPPSKRRPASKTKAAPADARPDVLDQLRRAIREARDSGVSDYALARDAGCHRIQIGRFMDKSTAGLKGSTIAGLCRALKLELRSFGRATKAA